MMPAIDYRRLYSGGLDDVGPDEQQAAAVRMGIVWPLRQPMGVAERSRRLRSRRRGELEPFPFLAADLYANAVRTSDGCLVWQRARTKRGYGHRRIGGQMVYAHRLSLEMRLGRSLGYGMRACHTCDNRPCIEPAHLFEGTGADNARDMRAKGRWHRRAVEAAEPERELVAA